LVATATTCWPEHVAFHAPSQHDNSEDDGPESGDALLGLRSYAFSAEPLRFGSAGPSHQRPLRRRRRFRGGLCRVVDFGQGPFGVAGAQGFGKPICEAIFLLRDVYVLVEGGVAGCEPAEAFCAVLGLGSGGGRVWE
jgi:hypothetical protein